MRRIVVATLLLSAFLAGCSNAPEAPAQVLIESSPPEEVHSLDGAQQPAADVAPKDRGHLAGVVVDEAIRPIAGAIIRLPGLDLVQTSDRDGSFGFVDLRPGPYYMTVNATGYYDAQAELMVEAEDFTRAKVVLKAIPPPDPYHVTQAFDGFADVTDTDMEFFGLEGLGCNSCDFNAYLDPAGLKGLVVEAMVEAGTPSNGFTYRLEQDDFFSTGHTGNPLRLYYKAEDLDSGADTLHVFMSPSSFPTPEQSKAFRVFLTAFYNEEPPVGWSFVNGDP